MTPSINNPIPIGTIPICTRSESKRATIENLRSLISDGVDPSQPHSVRQARPNWSSQVIRRVVQMARTDLLQKEHQ